MAPIRAQRFSVVWASQAKCAAPPLRHNAINACVSGAALCSRWLCVGLNEQSTQGRRQATERPLALRAVRAVFARQRSHDACFRGLVLLFRPGMAISRPCEHPPRNEGCLRSSHLLRHSPAQAGELALIACVRRSHLHASPLSANLDSRGFHPFPIPHKTGRSEFRPGRFLICVGGCVSRWLPGSPCQANRRRLLCPCRR